MIAQEVKVTLYDGYIIDKGCFPLFSTRGYYYSPADSIGITAPKYINHELLNYVLEKFGVVKKEVECKNPYCFGSFFIKRYEGGGLCKMHRELIARVPKDVVLLLTVLVFSAKSVDEKKIRDSLMNYLKVFSQHTGIETSIQKLINKGTLEDGTWLVITKSGEKYYSPSKSLEEIDRLNQEAEIIYKLLKIPESMPPFWFLIFKLYQQNLFYEYSAIHRTKGEGI